MKVAQNEKRKKLLGFSFYMNMGNFEAFLQNLNLSAKSLFWRCARDMRGTTALRTMITKICRNVFQNLFLSKSSRNEIKNFF